MAFREILLLRLILPVADRVMGTRLCHWYRAIGRMQRWTPEQVTQWQEQQLQAFVAHAYNHTVYYRRLFDRLGLTPNDIRCAEDLKKLPVITKEIVNAHYDELVPDNFSRFPHRKIRTGGTTGEPMTYLCSEEVWGYVTAAKIFYWRKTGYRYGDAFVALGSSSILSQRPSFARRVYDRLRNEHPLNSVDINPEKCRQYAEYLQRNRIRYLYGYAAALYVFTRYVADNHIDLTQIKAVFTTSENLPDNYRTLMEQTYQCRVMDCYGARDAGITAYETQRGCYPVGYNAIAEIVDPIGEHTGTLLTTNFLNYCFPLIRYQFGDIVELAEPDGSRYNGQIIQRVMGRTSSVIQLANGHTLSATGIAMVMRHFDIVAFDIRKSAPLEVTLRLQPTAQYSETQETTLREELRRYVGDDCSIRIVHVDRFEPLPNGKHQYFYT